MRSKEDSLPACLRQKYGNTASKFPIKSTGKVIFNLLLAMGLVGARASSGVPPFWLYEDSGAINIIRRSPKVDTAEYEGTKGTLKSKLYIFNIINKEIPVTPVAATTSECLFPKNSITCPRFGGPFSGVEYRLQSSYVARDPEAKTGFDLASGTEIAETRRYIALATSKYRATSDFKKSFGFYSFDAYVCNSGCQGGTPRMLIQVNLLGD